MCFEGNYYVNCASLLKTKLMNQKAVAALKPSASTAQLMRCVAINTRYMYVCTLCMYMKE